ncbi:MAG: DEDD exonuclease domain-containing protein [Euzebyaceae bacterium]|jgi:DNA polymerase-3 subunit epsilon|nr:DEDD exonuclease domain-containing protein [Euzebyaceae bacterium]
MSFTRPHQPSFDDLGTPLHATTFVVVDLETTGGSPQQCGITEFGAVKIHGGEVIGEFQSLVDPGQSIPASISALTGITDAMVAARPGVEAVLPTFLEFCRGAVLVAHNAGFDIGFLNAALARLDYPRLDNPVVCTAALARRLVRDEVRNCKLATLAELFRCRTVPIHRALADARATVEVFHGLLERAGSFGVVTLEDLTAFAKVRNTPLFASRRSLVDGLPNAPGVYAFTGGTGEILYIGKATDLRARVRSYFGSDDRRKIVDLLKESVTVQHWLCPTPLEAAVTEVRLIHAHRPRYNRRSKTPQHGVYLKLTNERFPRLSIVREAKADGAAYLGPLPSRGAAVLVAEAVQDVVPLRRCTPRIGPRTRFPACALAEMGRCLSPCDGSVSPQRYAEAVAVVTAALTGDPTGVVAPLQARLHALARQGRFEEAAAVRNRLQAFATAVWRTRRLTPMVTAGVVVASRPVRTSSGGAAVEVVATAGGRLVATTRCRPDDIDTTADQLLQRAAAAGEPGLQAALPVRPEDAEEVELVTRWLEGRGVVLHHASAGLALGVAGGRQLAALQVRLSRVHRSTGRPASELAAKRTRRPPPVEHLAVSATLPP